MDAQEQIVRDLFWSADLTDSEIERAAAGLGKKVYAKGSYICHRGDRYDFWTGVRTGLVKMSTVSISGKAITFAGIGNGSWFGEGTILKNEARKYDLVALRDTELLTLDRATFMWLHENSIGFNQMLLRLINERLGQFIATVEHDRSLEPKSRVARNLSWLFNPLLYPGALTTIEITQDELASLCGVSRAAVNRALQELQAEHLLNYEHGSITVQNPELLNSYGD